MRGTSDADTQHQGRTDERPSAPTRICQSRKRIGVAILVALLVSLVTIAAGGRLTVIPVAQQKPSASDGPSVTPEVSPTVIFSPGPPTPTILPELPATPLPATFAVPTVDPSRLVSSPGGPILSPEMEAEFRSRQKVSYALRRLMAAYADGTLTDVERHAYGIRPDGRVLVTVRTMQGRVSDATAEILRMGGQVGASSPDSVDALVPIGSLDRLGESAAVQYIDLSTYIGG